MTAQKRTLSRPKKRALKRKISLTQKLIGLALTLGIVLPAVTQSLAIAKTVFEPKANTFEYVTLPTGALKIERPKEAYNTPKIGRAAPVKNPAVQQISIEAVNSQDEVWEKLAKLESGGNWQTNTGNGYYGGLQFSQSTWESVGGKGLPCEASKEEQIMRGKILQKRSGWGQWPNTSRMLGLR